MGSEFINPPEFNLDISFKDSNCLIPLIFILSSGMDPITEIDKLAIKTANKRELKIISLGGG